MADQKTRILITAEDKTAAAFASAKSGLDRFSSAYASLGGLAGAGVVSALTATVRSMIDLGDETNDLSQRVGINIRDLATWQLAANQSGASMETVARGVKGLSGFMVENGAALKAAGINATDANGAMIQLADLFQSLPDGVQKTALAVKLFGKSGMDMIPMLNLGSAGLREAQEKAKAYGERLASLAPKADAFNDQMEELALQSKAAGMSLTDTLLPGLIGAATWLNDLASGGERGTTAMEFLREKTSSFTDLIPQLRVMAELAERVGPALALAGVGSDQARRTSSGKIGGKKLTIDEEIALAAKNNTTMAAQEAADRLREKEARAKLARPTKAGGSVDDYASRIQQDVAGAISGSAMVKADELADKIAFLDKLVFDYGLDLGVAASALDKLTGSTANAAKESERLSELLSATPSAALEKTRSDMQLLAQALSDGLIDDEKFNEAAIAVNKLGEAVKETDSFAHDLGLTFTSAFEDATLEGKKLSDVLDALVKDIGRVVLRKTVTEPLGTKISDFVTGSGMGDFFKGIFGGGKASGGAVDPSKFYLVGERGPELFAPGASGSIIPNHAMGGPTMVVNIIEDPNRGGQMQQRNDGGQNVLDVFVERIKSAIAGDIARGSGAVPAAMESTYGMNRAAGAF